MVFGPHAVHCSGRCRRGLGAGKFHFKRRRQACAGRHQAVTSARFTLGVSLVSSAWHRSLRVCVFVSVVRTAFCVQAIHMYIYVVLVCARTPHMRMIEGPSEKRSRVDPNSSRCQHPDGRISQVSFESSKTPRLADCNKNKVPSSSRRRIQMNHTLAPDCSLARSDRRSMCREREF